MAISKITLATFIVLSSTPAFANVLEFKGGEVVKHIAVDYRQQQALDANAPLIKTLTIIETIDAPESVLSLIVAAAEQHGVDANLVNAIMAQESNYNPKALSSKGAQGLMQLMPKTAERYGVKDAFDPSQNIDGGILYFKDLLARYNGNIDFALAAYNAGEGAVDQYGGIPPYKETLDYINRINRRLKRGAYSEPIIEIFDEPLDGIKTLAEPKSEKLPAALLVFGVGERVTN